MGKYDDKANGYGLVAVRMLKSEGGLGVNEGEIRGVSPEVAERMIDGTKAAELYVPSRTEATAHKEDMRMSAWAKEAVTAQLDRVTTPGAQTPPGIAPNA